VCWDGWHADIEVAMSVARGIDDDAPVLARHDIKATAEASY
jgi:hypothetical protein